MGDVNLAGIDLNLLVALNALLDERNVTRAAARVGLTQPAMSHALARLRTLFDDRLLVRSSNGMVPTARAQDLREPVRRLLEETERLLRPPRFDPASAEAELVLATTEYSSTLVIPSVLGPLNREAPGLKLRLQRWDRPGTWAAMQEGRVDLAIHGAVEETPPGFHHQRLFTDNYACVVRAEHALAGKRLTLKRFVAHKHALITVTGVGKGHVNEVLAQQGLSRDIVITIPSYLAAPMIVAQTDLVLTLPARLAKIYAPAVGLAVLKPPVELPDYHISMVWHERRHQDPAHGWLRNLIWEETRPLDTRAAYKP